ncbi:aspartate/glutamate racemase family protein [Aquimarina sp. MMG015]|uniref:aspartate/glutamate racemase family protein n=1 Tax=Aquimarina sp. MMG015 TaxID=2822689 RepID=UPI001B3A0C60|nr:amino acid racemase [Aquimarina sp. MMG015]MBQ4803342.1 aspartate/glutamate racemase family protein [Aquimarina sp. MMG015]
MKKKIGIISGMGTRAGLYFVNKLIDQIHAPKDQDFPEFILHNNSSVPDRTLAIVYGKKSPERELLRSIKMMNELQVDYIVLTCITSYHFVNMLDKELLKNILNPVELTINVLLQKGYRRIGLMATTGTIKSKLFHKHSEEIDLITLNEKEQEELFMKSIYMDGGLKSSEIKEEAYYLFEKAFDTLKEYEVDVMVGGCSEVQIGYENITTEIPYIDTMSVLVDEVIKVMNLKKTTNEQEADTFLV